MSRHRRPPRIRQETVFGREGLDYRRLAKRDRSILLRMPEPTVAEAIALRRHRWRRLVPFHAPVDRRISFAGVFLMASRPQLLRPIAPSATRHRRTYSRQVGLGQPRRGVQWIIWASRACCDPRQFSDRLPNGHLQRGLGFSKFDRTKLGRQQDQASATLGNPILVAGNFIPPHFVLLGAQCGHEILPNGLGRQPRNVLHRHDLGLHLDRKTLKFTQQSPAIVLRLPALRIGRKRLARRATRKNPNLGIAEPAGQIVSRNVHDVALLEFRASVLFRVDGGNSDRDRPPP